MNQPNPKNFPSYFNYYVQLSEGELTESLQKAHDTTQIILSRISEEKALHRYAEGKWSIKEVIQHLIDSERIFVYRALRFSRNDKTALPGFEQDDYVAASHADQRSMAELAHEYAMVRNSTIALFGSFSRDMLAAVGTANNREVSVEQIGRACVGHEIHHMNVIKEKYL